MASQRLKRGVRGALAATAVAVAAVGITPVSAGAQPATASDALKKYNELGEQATKLNEELLRAQEQEKNNQAELDKAKGEVDTATKAGDAARADEEKFRSRVDRLTEASFEGARFNQLSALLVSDSQQDFLNRMSALGVLAMDNGEALEELSGAVQAADAARDTASEAEKRAQTATDEAKKIADDVRKRKEDLDKQRTEVKAQLNRLTSAERTNLGSVGSVPTNVNYPAGAAGAALSFAMSQIGDMYQYGATGPNVWDCSGLVMKAYASAGVSIPRTSQGQAGVGRAVTRAEAQAGDIVVYNGGMHVGMAVSNSQVVHASTDGVPVKVVPFNNPGSIYAIRRIG